MKLELLKDWASNKKGDILEIKDKTLIDKGISLKLFKELKEKK